MKTHKYTLLDLSFIYANNNNLETVIPYLDTVTIYLDTDLIDLAIDWINFPSIY